MTDGSAVDLRICLFFFLPSLCVFEGRVIQPKRKIKSFFEQSWKHLSEFFNYHALCCNDNLKLSFRHPVERQSLLATEAHTTSNCIQ